MADMLKEDLELRIKLGKSFDKTQGNGGEYIECTTVQPCIIYIMLPP